MGQVAQEEKIGRELSSLAAGFSIFPDPGPNADQYMIIGAEGSRTT